MKFISELVVAIGVASLRFRQQLRAVRDCTAALQHQRDCGASLWFAQDGGKASTRTRKARSDRSKSFVVLSAAMTSALELAALALLSSLGLSSKSLPAGPFGVLMAISYQYYSELASALFVLIADRLDRNRSFYLQLSDRWCIVQQ